jgi:hypothetical protein
MSHFLPDRSNRLPFKLLTPLQNPINDRPNIIRPRHRHILAPLKRHLQHPVLVHLPRRKNSRILQPILEIIRDEHLRHVVPQLIVPLNILPNFCLGVVRKYVLEFPAGELAPVGQRREDVVAERRDLGSQFIQ